MGDSACVLQGNMMHNLTDSVSLGRFMSEQLAWEKWSTFSSNRYVEEAERYAQPGSVAQKKAFFEAHYKKIAAQKAAAAAAAAEQANSNVVSDSDSTNHAAPEAVSVTVTAPPPPPLTTHSHHAPPPPPPEKVEEEFMEPEVLVVKEEEPLMEVIAPPESEKPLLLQQNCCSEQEEVSSVKMKKRSAFSSLKSSVYRKTSSKIPVSSPAKLPQIKKHGGANGVAAAAATPTIKSKKKPALDFTDKKRPPAAPKSPLHLFVNSSPVKQLTQLLSPPSRKIDAVNSSRIAPDSSNKMSQNCKTPLQAQNMMSRHSGAVATPCPADTRMNTPADGIKTAGPKRHILSTLCSKSLTACRNKLQSPTLSTPFLLRTEERAARRKQKLEEKFNSKKDAEKVKVQPPQTSFKEKAECELRKLQQSFCFKARPLPDFYKEREAQNNQIKKNPVTTQPQPPKLGRKPNSSRTVKNAVSLPKSTPKKKSGGILKHVTASSLLQEMINHENSSPNIQQ